MANINDLLTTLAKRLRPLMVAVSEATLTAGEGPGIDIADNKVGLGGSEILLCNPKGKPLSEYAADNTGLSAALAAANPGDIIRLPANTTFSGTFVLPAGVSLYGAPDVSTRINGEVLLSKNESGHSSRLANLYLYHGDKPAALVVTIPDNYQSYPEIIENCWFLVDDNNKFCVDMRVVWGDWADIVFRDCVFEGSYGTTLFNLGENGDYVDGIFIRCGIRGEANWSTDSAFSASREETSLLPFQVQVFHSYGYGIKTNLSGNLNEDGRLHFVGTVNNNTRVLINKGGDIQTRLGVVLGELLSYLAPGAGELWFKEQSSAPSSQSGYIKMLNVGNALTVVDKAGAVKAVGDMTKAVYDTDNDNIVDSAEKVNGVDTAGNSKYYGTNASGTPGFYDLPSGSGGGTHDTIFTFVGDLEVGNHPLKIHNKLGSTQTISQVFLSCGTAPTGADIIVDIHKNGVTIFTTQSNRPRITAGNTEGYSTTIEVSELADGDYLTAHIDQIGSDTAGANLVVHVIHS